MVILHRSAKFGIPEPRWGFIPSQILPFLVRRLGEGQARYLGVTGTILDAAGAQRLGLGQFVCATAAALDRTLKAVLRDIGRMEPDALAAVKRLIRMSRTRSDTAVMDSASRDLVRLLRRPEARAGMQAFLLKTPPPWESG